MPKVRKARSVLAGSGGTSKHKAKKTKTAAMTASSSPRPLAQTQPPSLAQHSQQQQQQQQRRTPQAVNGGGAARQHDAAWRCASVIDQQAAEAVARLLAAAAARRGGASIKSLTLAPHVVHKKPTYAVTVETLRHLPLLRALLDAPPGGGDADATDADADAAAAAAHRGDDDEQQQQPPSASVGDGTSGRPATTWPPPQLPPAAMYVLGYELLFGEGLPRRRGPAEAALLRREAQLRRALADALAAAGAGDAAGWLRSHHTAGGGSAGADAGSGAAAVAAAAAAADAAVPHPRTARVNTLRASVADVLARFKGAKDSSSSNGSADPAMLRAAAVDPLLPDVLVLPAGTDLHDHPLVLDGSLVLQSRASCMPAHALAPRRGWHVVDCCAAPGNKTTHVAALLAAAAAAPGGDDGGGGSSGGGAAAAAGGKRKQRRDNPDAAVAPLVIAFDKDPKRLRRLQANVERAGAAAIVRAEQRDFLQVDPLAPAYANVRGVLLDPSCSGSGTVVSRMDHLLPPAGVQAAAAGAGAAGAAPAVAGGADADAGADDADGGGRVERLARFQEAALRHALAFPALRRLVYSTCSIHQRENEDVVRAVLGAARAAGFRLVDPFPGWPRRGVPGSVPGAERLVRTDPHADGTDGFFVAVFERGGGCDDGGDEEEEEEEEEQQQQQQQQQQQPAEGEGKEGQEQRKKKKKKKKARRKGTPSGDE